MFGIEFMTGAMSIWLFRMAFAIFGLVMLHMLVTFAYRAYRREDMRMVALHITFAMVSMAFLFGVVFGTFGPKKTIDLPNNRQQIEYDVPKEVHIVSPEPRTETMDGFKPLKQD